MTVKHAFYYAFLSRRYWLFRYICSSTSTSGLNMLYYQRLVAGIFKAKSYFQFLAFINSAHIAIGIYPLNGGIVLRILRSDSSRGGRGVFFLRLVLAGC